MTESSDYEQLFLDIVTGEVSADSPGAVQLFRKHPHLRERLAELRGLTDSIDELGSLRGEVLDEVAQSPPKSRVAVRDALASRLPAVRTRPKPRFPWWLTTAAVALLVSSLWWTGVFDPPGRLPEILGTKISDLWPQGTTKGLVEFRWSYDLPRGGWYELSVFWGRTRLNHVPPLTEARWLPTAEDAREWDGRPLRWEVHAFNADGTLEAAGKSTISYVPE